MEFIKRNRTKLIFLGIYAAAFLALVLIVNLDQLNAWLGSLLRVLRPLLIGLVISYFTNPIFRLYEKKLFLKVQPHGLRRVLALTLAYLTVFAILIFLLMLILPQLLTSVIDFVNNFDTRLITTLEDLNAIHATINQFLPKGADGQGLIPMLSPEMILTVLDETMSGLMPENVNLLEQISPEMIGSLFNVAGNVVSVLADTIFGLFISIYLLSTKEKRYAQIMRLRAALLDEGTNAKLTKLCTSADRSFGGFFKGKLLSSLVVGVLTYLLISLFRVPYAILIAAVIAVTDIIPVVGPFIGVVPSAVIILLTDPPKLIPFLLIILLIQQVEGNIISPKILGEQTGISSLCVIIAISVMGAIWGFAGMILGVPLFATVIELISDYLDGRLRKKGLPVQTEYYATDTMGKDHEKKKKTLFGRLFSKKQASGAAEGRSSALSDTEKLQLETYAIARRHQIFSEGSEEAVKYFRKEKEMLKERQGKEKRKGDVAENEQTHS